jgi:hypothetical protein
LPQKAFVLMPFNPEFDEIYNLFIASVLSEAGYEVFRADNIVSQRNILEDIISSIKESDLIVADLSSSNSNVYYELGLAHAVGKPVILLTQSVSELPFDLRSYRVIQYNTHFAAINDAKVKLKELAHAAKEGKVIFRSPVTDFGSFQTTELQSEKVEVDSDLGYLDYVIQMQDGFNLMTQVVSEIGKKMNEVTTETKNLTEGITTLANSGEDDKPRKMHKLLSEFAETQRNYAIFLRESNDKIAKAIDSTASGLEYVIAFKSPSTDEECAALESMLSGLANLEANSQSSLNSFSRLVTTMKALPKLERNLNRAVDEVIIQLERFNGYTQQVIAMSSKSITVAKKMLEL